MRLLHYLVLGPAVQVGPDLYSVPFILFLSVPLFPCDHQIAHPGALLLVLQWALYYPNLHQLLDVLLKWLLLV